MCINKHRACSCTLCDLNTDLRMMVRVYRKFKFYLRCRDCGAGPCPPPPSLTSFPSHFYVQQYIFCRQTCMYVCLEYKKCNVFLILQDKEDPDLCHLMAPKQLILNHIPHQRTPQICQRYPFHSSCRYWWCLEWLCPSNGFPSALEGLPRQ